MRFGARLLLVTLALLPARATPSNSPPPDRRDRTREMNAQAVENALRPCSRDAIDSGTFELIEIAFAYDTGKPFTPTIRSKRSSLPRQLYWCVERAIGNLLLDPIPDENRPYTQHFGLGEIAPLPREFLPAWQRALPDAARVKRALRGWLQPEIEVTSSGCLHVKGPVVLAEPFIDWRPPGSGRGFNLYNGDRLSPLPGDWWLRQRTQHTNTDAAAYAYEDEPQPYVLADDEFCLEHVDPAVSALFRADEGLHQIATGGTIFDVEWVVDTEGRVSGDIGLCFVPPPHEHEGPYTPDEADGLRRWVERVLRGLDYGRAGGSRQIRIRYDHALGLTVRGVRPAGGPLDRAASAIEAQCDRHALLRCTRTGEANEPSYPSVAPLRTCLRESGANDQLISSNFDIRPDGTVMNVRFDSTDSRALPLPACLPKAIAGLVFPRSEGGSCGHTTGMHELLWPRSASP